MFEKLPTIIEMHLSINRLHLENKFLYSIS